MHKKSKRSICQQLNLGPAGERDFLGKAQVRPEKYDFLREVVFNGHTVPVDSPCRKNKNLNSQASRFM